MVDYSHLSASSDALLSHGFCFAAPLSLSLTAAKPDLTLTTKAKVAQATTITNVRLRGTYKELRLTLQGNSPTKWKLCAEALPSQSPELQLKGEVGSEGGSLQVSHKLSDLSYSVEMTKGPVLGFRGVWNRAVVGLGASLDYNWLQARASAMEFAGYIGTSQHRLVVKYEPRGSLRLFGYFQLTDKVTTGFTAERQTDSTMTGEAGVRLAFTPTRSMTIKVNTAGLVSYVSRQRLWSCVEALYSVQVSTGRSRPAGLNAGFKIKLAA